MAKGAPKWASSQGYNRLPDPESIYKNLTERTGVPSLDEGLLVCEVNVEGKWDSTGFEAADLLIQFTVGEFWEVSLFGPEDTNRVFFSLARVKLDRGEALSVRLYDRELVGDHERIGDARVVFDGTLPIQMIGPKFRIACKASSPEDLKTLLDQALGKIDQKAPSVQMRIKADARSLDWGYVSGPLPKAQEAVEDAAALVGWEHPEVQRRVVAHNVLLDIWSKELKTAAERIAATTPTEGTRTLVVGSWGKASLKLLGARCTTSQCDAELEITPQKGSAIRPHFLRALSFDFVVPGGQYNSDPSSPLLTTTNDPSSPLLTTTDDPLVAGKTYALKIKGNVNTQNGANPVTMLRLNTFGFHFFHVPGP